MVSESLTYCKYAACKCADDLRHTAARGVQHAVGAGLEQQHTGQMEDQSWILRVLQLLAESLAVQKQSLSGWHTVTRL